MKSFNVICGLPRSGSTLLCNILNQNPDIYAGSTSILPALVNSATAVITGSPEVKGSYIRNPEQTQGLIDRTLKGIISSWYQDKKVHVFDKARAWSASSPTLRQLYPNSVIICMVRDLRSVLASIEKAHLSNPTLDDSIDLTNKTLYTRANNMFSPEGLIGSSIIGVEDLVRRNPENTVIIKYEDFVYSPQRYLKEIYLRAGINPFDHDYEDIQNTAEDVDGLYWNKFPHQGSGKLTIYDINEWRRYISQDLAAIIMDRFSFYNTTFKYLP